MKNPNITIIGHGKIGQKLEAQLRDQRPDWHIRYVVTRGKAVTHNKNGAKIESSVQPDWKDTDLAFLAIPTADNGDTALAYLLHFLKRGIPVVTCEKSALANHFEALQPYLNKIGYSATVGGGSDLIPALQRRMSRSPKAIHVVLNGTIHYIWNRLAQGSTLEKATAEAKDLGYTERNETDPIALVQNELDADIPRKVAILFNVAIGAPDNHISEELAMQDHCRPEEIWKRVREASAERFVVSFYRQYTPDSKGLSTLRRSHLRYVINAKFQSLNDPRIRRLCEAMYGGENGFITLEGESGTCLHIGEGAGPVPTANAMITDAKQLLAARAQ